MAVFVLDKRKKPLMPCSNKRARLLLERGRARVHKLHPFTIRLVDRYVEDSVLQDLTVKIDPGSKGTGIALVRETDITTSLGEIFRSVNILFLMELWYRGYSTRIKRHYGFQTGDICQAVVTVGKKIGTYVGRVAVRATGSFNIRTKNTLITDINHRFFKLLQNSNGYNYLTTKLN